MSKELTKKAAEMLLNGATLLSEPCPYCSGVRVMKEGHAFCSSCGREPKKRHTKEDKEAKNSKSSSLEETLEKKLGSLSKELEDEKNHEKQQEIIKSINSVLETLERLRK